MSLSFSIARRLYGHRAEGHRMSRPAVTIAMWGVAVGLAVMILSVCIILGFKGEIREKVIGFGGHVEVINYRSLYSAEAQPVVIDELLMHRLSRLEGVTHVQRFATKTGMLKTDEAFKGIVLRGLSEEYDTTFLAAHLLEGHLPQIADTTTANQIVVSSLMAQELNLKVGEKVYAYFFSENVKARRFLITGIYETHLREFDNTLVFTDLFGTQKLNGWETDQCSGAEIRIADFNRVEEYAFDIAQVMNRTQDRDGNTYSTHSIKELYPGIFSWLSLLDTNVYVILILMILLSIFTMTAGLLILISQVRHIFLHFAAMLIGRGLVIGNILGIGLALLQKYGAVVHLDPATYYVDAVPIQFSWSLIVVLNIATLLLTTLVLTIPSHLVSRIQPARVMRFD